MTTTDRPIVIDTPEGIAMVRVLTARAALRLEVNTGMKSSRFPILPIVNDICGTNFRNKRKALDHMNAMLAEFDAAKV